MRNKERAVAVVSALLLGGCAASGSTTREPLGERLDRMQQRVYEGSQRVAERFDTRFSKADQTPLPFEPTPFRIGIETAAIDRADGVELPGRVDLDFSLALPNIERRLRLFVTTDDLTDSPELDDRRQNRLRIGARYAFLRDVDFDVGVRAEVWPTTFTSLRWSQLHLQGNWRWAPFVKTYFESDDGFGVATGFTIDRFWGPWLLRSSSFYDWQTRSDAAAWTQAFVLARAKSRISEMRPTALARVEDIGEGWALRLAVGGEREFDSRVSSYAATLLFKRHLHGRWLYGYAGPEVRFDRKYDWNPDYGVRVGIDALFRERER